MAAQSPETLVPHQAEASTGSGANDAKVKRINLGFLRLKTHRPSSREITLRELAQIVPAKSTPYASNHGVSGVKLNEMVPVSPTKGATDSKLVVCRHLATVFAQHVGKKSEVMQTFSTAEGIAKKFDGKLTEAHDAYMKVVQETPPGCKHLVNSDQLGAYISAMAAQLQAPGSKHGPSEANCLVTTSGHAMALHVERKSRNGVEFFPAKFYDPNETANYKRVVKANPEDFGNLKLKDMMIRPGLIRLYTLGENKPLAMVALSLDHRLKPRIDPKNTQPSVDNMHLALRVGQTDEVRSMLQTARKGGQTPNEHFELLQAVSPSLGRTEPGLFSAFGGGQTDVIRELVQHILGSEDLDQHAKVELLSAKCSDGVPGFYTALQNGRADVTTVFVQEVLASNLSLQAKVGLLAAKRSDGVPGLFVAFQNGHSDTVKVFTQEVLASKELEPQEKFDLLAPIFNGVPGLFKAFQNGHSDTVQAFAQEVLASKDLTAQAKVDLLAARHTSEVPGLAMAKYEGHDETVKVFSQIVRKSSALNAAQKDTLLSPLNSSEER